MTTTVDSAALLELVWAAPLAALTVIVAWGLVVYGSTRAAEARRDGRTAGAALHARRRRARRRAVHGGGRASA